MSSRLACSCARSVVRPGSAWLSCGAEFGCRDNVPVFSWLLLPRRCRNLALRHIPGATRLSRSPALLVVACVGSTACRSRRSSRRRSARALVAVSATDLEHRIVPNRIVLSAAVVVLVAQTMLHPSVEWAAAAFRASAFLFIVALAYPAGMGMGDVSWRSSSGQCSAGRCRWR